MVSRTVSRDDQVSNPPAAILKLRQLCSPYIARVFQERLKAVGPFYLVVSRSGEVKDPK